MYFKQLGGNVVGVSRGVERVAIRCAPTDCEQVSLKASSAQDLSRAAAHDTPKMNARKRRGAFLLACFLLACFMFVNHQHAAATGARVRHVVVFDAGSTGTRVSVFRFHLNAEGIPTMTPLAFKSVPPGLSAYAKDPEKAAVGLRGLLKAALSSIPPDMWSSTPVLLRATAGLRLLPEQKAQRLLDTVNQVFRESPLLHRRDQVSIMTGTDEGIFAWISLNYLAGNLVRGSTAGMMDLGGGSIQITFSPRDERTLRRLDAESIGSFRMFNLEHTVYAHSYLGLGLMSARLGILGATGGSTELVSPCLAPEYSGSFKFGHAVYAVKGQKAGEMGYEACLRRAQDFVDDRVQKVAWAADMDFYAFSFFYDRAVDLGFRKLGTIKVSDYINGAKKVCRSKSVGPEEDPFFCMDLVYVSVLLQKLGFSPRQQFKVVNTINHLDVSWTLGAALQHLETH